MTFWIITSAMAMIIAVMLALTLLRSRAAAGPAAAFDMQVYRDQLRDVDRDLDRGVIGEADASRIRTEVSRRILAADAQMQAGASDGGQSGPVSLVMAVVLGVVLIAGSLTLYLSLGVPGYGDLGLKHRIEVTDQRRENRPGQIEAEASLPETGQLPVASAEYLSLIKRLREAVTEHPDDLRGQMLLARNEAATGNFKAARLAQAEVLRLRGDAATTGDYAEYADMLIMAAGGYVSPEAESVLGEILERDAKNGLARYYTGLMMAQSGRPDMAFRIWNALLQEGPEDAPWIGAVRAQIEDVARFAGVNFTLPVPREMAPGPSAADVDAASEMSGEARLDMIRGMVQGLSDRLAHEGGSAMEWARLIGALGVLGETEQAKAIHANALEVFAGDEAALAEITGAAQQAGIAR